jgi:hypothetical protein
MKHPPYLFEHPYITRYTFMSLGRKRIPKVVDFTDLGMDNIFNIAFGDMREDGTMDDRANSNNGDIVKVLSTVISILKDFTEKQPEVYVAFTGSTEDRMRLYGRILRSYYSVFSKDFKVSAFIRDAGNYKEVPFDPKTQQDCVVFLVKRIN